MTDTIDGNLQDGAFVISVNRAEKRNAVTIEMAIAIAAKLAEFDADPRARVAVLYGSGGVFSAGMDLKRFAADGTRPLDPVRGGAGITWRPPDKPIIAAVEGCALGLGFEMALACDLIVAAEDAEFGLPEVRHGLVAAGGGAIKLPSRIPHAVAMEILLTGQRVGALRLRELGLVNRTVAPGSALQEAVCFAAEIPESSAEAVYFTKELAVASRSWPEAEAFQRQEPLVAEFLSRRRAKNEAPHNPARSD